VIPPVARRFVAGETGAEALEHARQLRERDVGAILNLLGEHYHDPAPAREDAAAYRRLVADVGATDLDVRVSIKPSQLGLAVDGALFETLLGEVVETAREHGVFVWLDMEDHATTDATLDAFERAVTDYPRMGVCVQANLVRTGGDIERLVDLPGSVRLVKGAYDEPADIAIQDRRAVDAAFHEHLEHLFREGEHVAVGSHDPAMVERAIELHGECDTPFEIQMLMGVREDAQFELARDHDVVQYVPFGRKWFSYFSRRVTERRENLAFALRAVLRR